MLEKTDISTEEKLTLESLNLLVIGRVQHSERLDNFENRVNVNGQGNRMLKSSKELMELRREAALEARSNRMQASGVSLSNLLLSLPEIQTRTHTHTLLNPDAQRYLYCAKTQESCPAHGPWLGIYLNICNESARMCIHCT